MSFWTIFSICFLLMRSSESCSNISCLFSSISSLSFFFFVSGSLRVELLVVRLVLGVQAAHLVDQLDDALGVPLLVELGVFLVDVADDLLDADLLPA